MNKLTVSSLSFPNNPVNDLLIINSLTRFTSDIYYSILDAAGNVIISNVIIEKCEGMIKISVDSLKKGLYLLRLSTEDSYVVGSFVKE